MSVSWQIASVKAIRTETPTTKTFTLSLPDWTPHAPGQYYDLRLTAPDGYRAQRSYSIASPPEQTGQIDLTIERLEDGEVSGFMHEVVIVGDGLEVRGPFGGYFTWEPDLQSEPVLLLGGGSGIVPLMSILRHRQLSSPATPASLLYSIRTEEQFIFQEELMAMAYHDPLFHLATTFTRSNPPEQTGYHRRVDQPMLSDMLAKLPDAPWVYICGPHGFVESASQLLVEMQIDPNRILTERFGPTS